MLIYISRTISVNVYHSFIILSEHPTSPGRALALRSDEVHLVFVLDHVGRLEDSCRDGLLRVARSDQLALFHFPGVLK